MPSYDDIFRDDEDEDSGGEDSGNESDGGSEPSGKRRRFDEVGVLEKNNSLGRSCLCLPLIWTDVLIFQGALERRIERQRAKREWEARRSVMQIEKLLVFSVHFAPSSVC